MSLTFTQIKQTLATDFPLYKGHEGISEEKQKELIEKNNQEWIKERRELENGMKTYKAIFMMDDRTDKSIQQELNAMNNLLDSGRTLLKMPYTRDVIKVNTQSLIDILGKIEEWRKHYWGDFKNGEWTRKKNWKFISDEQYEKEII